MNEMKSEVVQAFTVRDREGNTYRAREYQISHKIQGRWVPGGKDLQIDGADYINVVSQGVYKIHKYGREIDATAVDPNAP